MSGRSAYVRAKNSEISEKRPIRQYSHYAPDDPYVYGYGDLPQPLSRPGIPAGASYMSPSHVQRRSHSSFGSAHSYPSAPHLHKPRPIVFASAIEKSEFRTHLDGMSETLRGKLGDLMKGGKKELEKDKPRRPGTSSYDSQYEYGSRSTQLTTPSIGTMPSLSHSDIPSEATGLFPSAQTSFSIPTRQKQPPDTGVPKIRSYEGGGRLPQLGWKSLSNNPELWNERGDTYVYMYMHDSRTKPPPSFRVDSRVLLQSRSKAFIDQLHRPSEPEGWPKFCPSNSASRSGSPSRQSDLHSGHHSPSGLHSDDNYGNAILPLSGFKFSPKPTYSGIMYEIYVPWPGSETAVTSTIWHITTRNFFAIMYNANALVGTSLYDAMRMLLERVTKYPDYLGKDIDKVAWITDYIVRHRFDDVRNNPSSAASLVAFSELPDVQWREGYIEAFVHCVGMSELGLRTIDEWQYVMPHTKAFINNAHMEIEQRITRAQRWFENFDFHEMWPRTTPQPSVARACHDRLRKWLCKYYENAFLHWPPSNERSWLTRDIILRLEADFYGLYDYLVDRDKVFESSGYSSSLKWTLTSRSGQNFRADTFEFPLTDILIGFDDRNGYPHIPHPYPIAPPPVSTVITKKSAFTLKKSNNSEEVLEQSREKALSYAEASNVYNLRNRCMHAELTTSFIQFEQQDEIEMLDPFEARRGRWILIYGILQVLATLAVDSPNLAYKDNAQYYLCPQMKGIVPWGETESRPEEEADHKLSHCWVVPSTWGPLFHNARQRTQKPNRYRRDDGNTLAEVRRSVLSVRTPSDLGDGKTREASIGRKRAEDWVNADSGTGEFGSENGVTIDTTESIARSDGVLVKSEHESMDSGIGSANDDMRADTKRRRKVLHGFSNYEAPKEW